MVVVVVVVVVVLQFGVQGTPIKNNPLGEIDISGNIANFVAKFTVFTKEDSVQIFCKSRCEILLHSKIITI